MVEFYGFCNCTSCAESGTAILSGSCNTSLVSCRHIHWKPLARSRKLISDPGETALDAVCPCLRRRRSRLHLHPPTDSRARKRALRLRRRAARRYPGQDCPMSGGRDRQPTFQSQLDYHDALPTRLSNCATLFIFHFSSEQRVPRHKIRAQISSGNLAARN